MKRIVVVLGLAALTLALIAGPVTAQAEVTREVYEGSIPTEGQTATVELTCGELSGVYDLSYNYKAFITTVTRPNGEQTTNIHSLILDGQAVNAETGRTFLFQNVSNETHQKQGELNQFSYTALLVSTDGETNIFLHITARLDENGEPVFEFRQERDNCPV